MPLLIQCLIESKKVTGIQGGGGGGPKGSGSGLCAPVELHLFDVVLLFCRFM